MEYTKKITDVGQMRYDGADEELKTTSQRSESARISIGGGAILAVEEPNDPLRPAGNLFKLFVLGSGDGAASYHVDTVRYRCLCVFMKNVLLPCRHVMYWRRHIAPHWKLSCKLNQPAAEKDAP
ncbi:hypothetical protein JG688_00017516 [Phytophthora aleatoria]|uniref:SWIM-type domain-containing protein n=1 Tax=Phytophthora aleatoria TaxID=2496075 RepID=A0A8J5IAD2_9STRA|nr:hypothetical protein JG688_00017516 [Phytophthora aleatoria]